MKTIDTATFVKQKRRAEQSTNIVHVFKTDEPHVVDGDVCWCEPGIEDFRGNGGGILIIHNAQIWN